MTALLSQGSYRAVTTQPFHGNISYASNALEDIRTSDHSEWLETNNYPSLPIPASRKPIKVLDFDHCTADLAYFTFRSVVSAVVIDNRAPDKSLSLDFSLHFPQTLAPHVPSFGLPSVTIVAPFPMATTS